MHIADGILDFKVFSAGLLGMATLAGIAARKLTREQIPRISIMGAAFFVSSLIHFQIGVTSIHPTLIGIIGIILGPFSIFAILTGLFFQAVMFGHGGLSSIGINTLIMYLPALFIFSGFKFAFGKFRNNKTVLSISAGILTSIGVLLSAFFAFLFLFLSGSEYSGFAAVFSISYGILALIEAALTIIIIRQILNIKPEMLFGAVL